MPRSGYQRRIDSLSPTYWLRFDENGLPSDYGSSSLSVTAVSDPEYNQSSTFGTQTDKSVLLDGNDGFTSTASASVFNDKVFSVEVWFKIASGDVAAATSNYHTFFRAGNGSQEFALRMKGAAEAVGERGKIQAYIVGGSGYNTPVALSSSTYHDNAWHHAVMTVDTTNVKLYIDGSEVSSVSTGSMPTSLGLDANTVTKYIGYIATNEGTKGSLNELAIYNSALTSTQVSNNWAARNAGNYDAEVMTVSTATFPMPAVSGSASEAADPMIVSNSTFQMPAASGDSNYTSGVFGDNFDTATFINPLVSINVNLDAFGVATASADTVHPIIETIKNVSYAADPAIVSNSTLPMPVIAATKTVNYSASPVTASALFAGNTYAGPTTEDTTYHVTLRQITDTGNTDAKNGFYIGSTYGNDVLTFTHALAIKANSGIPSTGTLIKVKFHPTHVGVNNAGNSGNSNRFNVYVFTANPSTTFNTMTVGNIPAKELLYTTRSDDTDGQRIDLTTAFRDSRAATYGIYIEHVGDTPYGTGTYWDRTEYTGTNLEDKVLYILTSDFLNININAAPATAIAEFTAVTLDVQKYVNFQDGVATATADIVHPVISTEQGNTYTSGTLNASANAVQPGFVADTIQISGHFEADARMGLSDPVIFAAGTINVSASPMTANALFHMPQANIGENNIVDHMNASALMVQPTIIINESVEAMVATVSATMPDASIAGQLLGVVSAGPMLATAFSPVPSNFDILTNDPWFNRLYNQDALSTDKDNYIWFMNATRVSNTLTTLGPSAGNLGLNSSIWDVGYTSSIANTSPVGRRAVAELSDNGIASPAPTLFQGIFDQWDRRAVRFRNIAYRWRNPIGGSAIANSTVDRGYTQEAMIRTTKANQILFIGQNGGTFEANPIGLKNGKLFIGSSSSLALQITDSRMLAAYNAPIMQATKTNIADGQWHHILIQFGFDGRHQIWVDGELEIQRYGLKTNYNSLIGYNSGNTLLSSDFELSVFSTQIEQFLGERDVSLNYQAAVKYTPILADAMVASTNMTQDHEARGNRGRALMLYFWSTRGLGNNTYYAGAQGGLDISLQRNTSFDQGTGGYFDYDTSINASTWELLNQSPQQWYGWDIFPVDVQGQYISSVVKDSSYKNPRTAGYFTGSTPVYWEQADGFYDETTDNRRYIDLLKDIDNLEDYDMIFFRNYPDQGSELDSYAKFESVDPYFNLQERVLFEDFLKSLRAAVDTGISLLITNPQLAIDLGVVDRVEEVEDLTNVGNTGRSDSYAKQRLIETVGSAPKVNTDPGLEDTQFSLGDTYKNNKHRVVRNIEGLTTIPGWIWTDHIRYNNDGARDFGGNSRWWDRYEYRNTGLSIGNEFLIATSSQKGDRYLGVPVPNIKAGKAVTTFGSTVVNGTTILNNPYANYATSIVVEPGDNLAGKQCGGKIFVSFTDILQQHSNYNEPPKEFAEVDLLTDEVINQAYADGAISLAQRNAYINDPDNLDRRLASGALTQSQYNGLKYWTSNGDYIISTLQYINTAQTQQASTSANTPVNFSEAPTAESARFFGDGGPWFQVKWAWQHPRTTIQTLTINNRGMYWLKNRVFLEGQIQRPSAFTANASMPNATVSVERENIIRVTPMLSNARMPSGDYVASENTPVLPFEASARFGQFVKVVPAEKATASALMGSNVSILTSSQDEVVLYLNHVDPILYVREDIVK